MDHSQHQGIAQSAAEWFSTVDFMPHGHCYLWKPLLVTIHSGSDTIIGLAYISISLSLYTLVKKINLPFSWVFLAFGAFIGFCGLTHFMEVFTLWVPEYWWSGFVKVITAIASIATAIILYPLMPKILAFAHTAQLSEERRIKLEETNSELSNLYKKLKEMDSLKTDFFSNISHELRTPLTLILGPLEELKNNQQLAPKDLSRLDLALKNSKILLKQVNDLLEISKLEAKKLEPNYVEFDLGKLLRVTAANFESIFVSKDLAMSIEGKSDLIIQADPDQMQRVLMNLLSNAYKYSSNGSKVICSIEDQNGDAIIRVQNTGSEIKEEERAVIFQRFHQIDGGITRKVGGTGLGLAIVKELIEIHGGNVEVENRSDITSFKIRLPLVAPKGTVVQASYEPDVDTSSSLGIIEEITSKDVYKKNQLTLKIDRPHVLVVEDNDELNSYICGLLDTEYNVSSAANGVEALEILNELKPDLLITDIMMPEMSGDQLVFKIRESASYSSLPILLLSAKADEELKVNLLKGGAQDFVVKPFDKEELLARVSNLIKTKKVKDLLQHEVEVQSDDLVELAREISLKKHQLESSLALTKIAHEEAERSSQAKTQFLGLVSHELKTPLTSLYLNLQMMDRIKTTIQPQTVVKQIEKSMGSSQALINMIESLLEYSRLQSGSISIQHEEINLKELAQNIVDEITVQAKSKGLDFKSEISDVPSLYSDTRLIRIIISNLLSNAIKFTVNGSVMLRVYSDNDTHTIEVTDTGPGIEESEIARIFEPFYQAEPVQRKKTSGVGLGLSLVAELVKAINGEVKVSSKVGKGSTFSVTI